MARNGPMPPCTSARKKLSQSSGRRLAMAACCLIGPAPQCGVLTLRPPSGSGHRFPIALCRCRPRRRVPAFPRVGAREDRAMSVRLGVAIIGLGNAFEPHAKSLRDLLDRVDVRWAAAPSGDRLQDVAARHVFPVTTDIDQAIADPEVAAVILLSPANTHLELARRCFALGKHVLCEKPLDITVERAELLVDAGRRAGVRLGVVLQSRFRPGSVRLRRALQAGTLGRIEAASLVVPWWRPQEYYDEPGRGTRWRDGGGVLLTQAIHALDLFRSLVGVREVSAAQVATTGLHRMETEDYAAALVR